MHTVDKMRYAVGIDLGGTFVKFVLVSESGDILLEDNSKKFEQSGSFSNIADH